MEPQKIKQVLEAAILASDSPLDRDAMLMLFDEADRPAKDQLGALLDELKGDYDERGIELREVASGFRFQVRKELGPWVSRLWAEKAPRYSRAILETMALVAYRQPITRGEIEEIRGVAVSTHIIKTLLERNWVRVVGHRDVPGRPAMYATTRQFLDYFDLKSLDELPPLSEIKDLDKFNGELELEGENAGPGENAGEAETAAPEGENGEQDATVVPLHAGGASGNERGASDESNTVDDAHVAAPGEEPDIDESELMKMDRVDEILASVEASFRKPKQEESQDDQDGHDGQEEDVLEAGDTVHESDEQQPDEFVKIAGAPEQEGPVPGEAQEDEATSGADTDDE